MRDWKRIKLRELLTESKIGSTNPDPNKRLRVKLNVGGVDRRPETNDKVGATKYYIRKTGQFIYGKQNLHKGAFGIVPEELDGYESSSDLPAFDVSDSCYPEWIFYFFKQGNFYLKLSSLAKGIGSKRIQPDQLFDLNILLPSKEDQSKILESIYAFERRHFQLTKEVEHQIDLLMRLRSTVLNEAFKGKLSEEWRTENSKTESAAELIKKIKKERNSIKGNRIGVSKKYLITDERPYQIPNKWVWCRLSDYVVCERGRFSARPRNDPKFYNGNIPFIQIGDLSDDGGLINEHKQTLNELGLKVSKLFPKGSVVIAIVGSTIGNTGILNYDMCFPDSLVGIKPDNFINPQFVEFFLRSKKDYFRNIAYAGGGQPNIKLPIINDCLIPLPPLEEQKVIVNKIESTYSYCDKLILDLRQQSTDLGSLMASSLGSIWGDENEIPELTVEPVTDDNSRTFNLLLNTLTSYEKKDIFMELEELLKENGSMSAISLWQMSQYHEDIDKFYDELKKHVEVKKSIKESKIKGYLELAK